MTSEINYPLRKLELKDVDAYVKIRLEMLSDSPAAFGMSFEEESARPRSFYEEKFGGEWGGPENGYYGVFDGSQLVATFGLFRQPGLKERHHAFIYGMYVRPSHRGRGLARKLLIHGIEIVETWKDIIQLNLTVGSYNRAAIELYRSLGFKTWGTEPRALKVGNDFFDEDHMWFAVK